MKLEFDPKTGKITLNGQEVTEETRLLVRMDERTLPYPARCCCRLAYEPEGKRFYFRGENGEPVEVRDVFACDVFFDI